MAMATVWLRSAAAALAVLLASPAPAQGLFATVATVDGMAVNRFQVDQRALFLTALGAPDSDPASVRETLIDEALQTQAARGRGIEPSEEDVEAGVAEFAGRANSTPEAFLARLEAAGVAPETVRAFVRAGLSWRQLVQARFGRSARPEDEDVEAALVQGRTTGGDRVLLSEIALPLPPGREGEIRQGAAELAAAIRSADDFQEAARRFSRAPSAERGGRLDWLQAATLAPPVAREVLDLPSGGVTGAIDLGNFIGIYLLRARDEGERTVAPIRALDYASFALPAGAEGREAARRIGARADACDDLYGVVSGAAPERLERATVPLARIPDGLRQTLAALDPGEAAFVEDGPAGRLVMLCGREAEATEEALETVGARLLNRRVTDYAQGYLEELRADATITRR